MNCDNPRKKRQCKRENTALDTPGVVSEPVTPPPNCNRLNMKDCKKSGKFCLWGKLPGNKRKTCFKRTEGLAQETVAPVSLQEKLQEIRSKFHYDGTEKIKEAARVLHPHPDSDLEKIQDLERVTKGIEYVLENHRSLKNAKLSWRSMNVEELEEKEERVKRKAERKRKTQATYDVNKQRIQLRKGYKMITHEGDVTEDFRRREGEDEGRDEGEFREYPSDDEEKEESDDESEDNIPRALWEAQVSEART